MEQVNQKECQFCKAGEKEIDYKDIESLKNYIGSYKKILPPKKTGACAKHQRKIAIAIKRARAIALLPFVRR
jgi:small subunit ribosomal protein S18